jgi:hypothetical protein
MPQLTFKALQREAARHGLTLDRIDRTRGGVRMRVGPTQVTVTRRRAMMGRVKNLRPDNLSVL